MGRSFQLMGSGSQLYDQSESKLQLLDKIKMFEYALTSKHVLLAACQAS